MRPDCIYYLDGKPLSHAEFKKTALADPELSQHFGVEKLPSMPFSKTWHELALKRMLRWASEHGYDKLAWTTGEQQAARYDLSKQVSAIYYKKNPDGTYHLRAKRADAVPGQPGARNEVSLGDSVLESKLAETIGKDQAETVIRTANNAETGWTGVLRGLDLKVGGEGMKGFYDQMLPSFLNTYTKKWGGRVSETTLKAPYKPKRTAYMTPEEQLAALKRQKTGDALTVHSLDLTPSMKAEVMGKGQARGFLAIPEEEPTKQAVKQSVASGAARTRAEIEGERLGALQRRVDDTGQRVATAAQKLSEHAKMLLEEGETVAKTGTLSEPTREPFRETGPKPVTRSVPFSEEQIKQSQAEVVTLAREVNTLRRDAEAAADPFTSQSLKFAEDLLNRAADRYRTLRFAAGRAVKTFDIPPDMRADLEAAGTILTTMKQVRERLPIYTSLVDKLKRANQLTSAERSQVTRDLIDAYRLNLFPLLSFSRDIIGNSAELGFQVVGAAGRDLGQVTRGHLNAPNLQGFFRAVKFWRETPDGLALRKLPEAVREGIGISKGRTAQQDVGTIQGVGKGAGTFTRRATPGTAAVDYLVGSPLYAKGLSDTQFRRLGAAAELWAKAGEAANAKGLRGQSRRMFLEEFFANPPKDALDAVIREGNKAGFNRPLGQAAVRYTSNPVVKLAIDAFPRWPFQFVKAAGEWLGLYNPELLASMRAGTATREALFEYLSKTATGWGGLWWLNRTVYDRVDWKSMEYVHDSGNRTRLSSLDPITTGLWFLAVLRAAGGDKRAEQEALSALKFASIPFLRFADPDGGSGLLSSFVNVVQMARERGQLDPRGARRELTDWVNRAIPAQAVLSFTKAVTDPVAREGVGGNLPGVSKTKPAVINRATGTALRPTQRIAGVDLPAVSGTALPGAERVLDPVTQLLSKAGLLLYRGPKSTIAGVPPNDIPPEWRREWTVELGRQRQVFLRPWADRRDLLQRAETDRAFYEWLRKQVQAADAKAAKEATRIVQARHGGSELKTPRRLTQTERTAPRALTPY